jgi:hypothetical protein
VLVGGFTFSPTDLACRRSDTERFIDEVLDGLEQAFAGASAQITVKLHPADEADHYDETLAGRKVDLRVTGDVVDIFTGFDFYVAPYSSSLLEALAVGLPVVYYRVNAQRVGPPFDGDTWLGGRTASTPFELAALLRDRRRIDEMPPPGWLERYLGPRDGRAADRIAAAIHDRVSI